MKKILFFAITALLAINTAHAQSGWINYKIDDKISVKLPGKPTEMQPGTNMITDKDSSVYLTTLVDFVKVANVDSAALAPYLSTQEFANGLKTGMLSKMPNSTLGDVKIDKWKGYYSYSVDGGNAEKNFKLYTYMVIIGSKMYGLMAIIPNGNDTKGKDDFFASLTLN